MKYNLMWSVTQGLQEMLTSYSFNIQYMYRFFFSASIYFIYFFYSKYSQQHYIFKCMAIRTHTCWKFEATTLRRNCVLHQYCINIELPHKNTPTKTSQFYKMIIHYRQRKGEPAKTEKEVYRERKESSLRERSEAFTWEEIGGRALLPVHCQFL